MLDWQKRYRFGLRLDLLRWRNFFLMRKLPTHWKEIWRIMPGFAPSIESERDTDATGNCITCCSIWTCSCCSYSFSKLVMRKKSDTQNLDITHLHLYTFSSVRSPQTWLGAPIFLPGRGLWEEPQGVVESNRAKVLWDFPIFFWQIREVLDTER